MWFWAHPETGHTCKRVKTFSTSVLTWEVGKLRVVDKWCVVVEGVEGVAEEGAVAIVEGAGVVVEGVAEEGAVVEGVAEEGAVVEGEGVVDAVVEGGVEKLVTSGTNPEVDISGQIKQNTVSFG